MVLRPLVRLIGETRVGLSPEVAHLDVGNKGRQIHVLLAAQPAPEHGAAAGAQWPFPIDVHRADEQIPFARGAKLGPGVRRRG